ncbi:hypothetical protein [Magnetofaba australis]|uniref:hypothetical protein n=1 Tax=Magnetofaba australis TaxID=1472297 RepID=UPI00117D779E|nr:hypothetical protein [Magnetofaba australis]
MSVKSKALAIVLAFAGALSFMSDCFALEAYQKYEPKARYYETGNRQGYTIEQAILSYMLASGLTTTPTVCDYPTSNVGAWFLGNSITYHRMYTGQMMIKFGPMGQEECSKALLYMLLFIAMSVLQLQEAL